MNRSRRSAPAVLLSLPLAVAALAAPRAGHIDLPGGRLEVHIGEGPLALTDAEVRNWVETAALAVANYYRRFPVPLVRVEVSPEEGRGVWGGMTYPGAPPRIEIALGDLSDDRDLERDWTMTHELVHLGFPTLDRRHHWLEEGLATYVEPLARLRLGQLDPQQAWGEMARDMPQGLPEDGDQGLDHTHTWGRTYWGGAIFWLLADVEIRERTGNRCGLEHALAAIVAAGGVISAEWDVREALGTGDRALGVAVLEPLYERMCDHPAPADLGALWKKLGVVHRGRRVVFDDGAAAAAVRRAITTGAPVG